MLLYFTRKLIFSKNAGSIVRGISFLCMTGIGLSVFATILVVSIMLGLNDSIHDRTLAIEPYFELRPKPDTPTEKQVQELKSKLSSFSGAHIFAASKQDLLVRTIDGLSSGVVAYGYEQKEWEWVWQRIRAKNEFLDAPKLYQQGIAVGIDLAHELGIYEDEEVVLFSPESLLVAATERPEYQKVKVAKIIRTDSPAYDSRAIFYDAFLGLPQISSDSSKQDKIHIRLNDKNDYKAMKRKLNSLGLSFTTWEDKNRSLLFALKMERYAMSLFLLFTVLIASFSIFSVLSLVINQKRKDIGLLQAYGMSKNKVRNMFSGVGLLLSLVGILFGGFVAILTALALKEFQFLQLPQDIYYDYKVPIRIDPWFIVSVLVGASFVAAVGSIIPSALSLKESIVDLIRGKTTS